MVDLSGARVVAVLTRAPSAGGKTRLFRALGRAPDPALLEALLLDTVDRVSIPGVSRIVAVAPREACGEVERMLPEGVVVIPQSDGGLGERMRSLMAQLLTGGAAAVAVIGSDLPELDPAAVLRAFERLDEEPRAVVLGPAVDGGYYLIAASRVPDLFEGIDWGTHMVLEQTLQAAAAHQIPLQFVAPMADIDTVADLERIVGGQDPQSCTRTAAWALANGVRPWYG